MNNVIRRFVAAGALGMALASFGMKAQAQTGVEKPWSVQVGAYLPIDKHVRSASSDTLLMVEGRYTIQNLIESNSITVVSVGYTQGQDFLLAPITLAQIFRNSPIPGTGYYYGGGLGFYIADLDAPDTSGRTKNLFGGYLLVGMNFAQGRGFAEAKYHIVNQYDTKQVDGLQISVGGRF